MATPAYQLEFSFFDNCFYVEALGNRYRRATLAELQAHFSGNQDDATEHTNEWYAAQVKHYGLDTSSDNDTAKVRLSDAVMKGHLAVPGAIKALEDMMRKLWNEIDPNNPKLVLVQLLPPKNLKRKADDDKPSAAGRSHGNIIVPVFATDEMTKSQGKKPKTAASTAASGASKSPSSDATAAEQAGTHGNQVGITATDAAPTTAATPLATDATEQVGTHGKEADAPAAKASGDPVVATSETVDVPGDAKEPQVEATDPLAGGSHDVSDAQNPTPDDRKCQPVQSENRDQIANRDFRRQRTRVVPTFPSSGGKVSYPALRPGCPLQFIEHHPVFRPQRPLGPFSAGSVAGHHAR